MKVLITGVCGFAGSSLARIFRERIEGLQLFGIDNLVTVFIADLVGVQLLGGLQRVVVEVVTRHVAHVARHMPRLHDPVYIARWGRPGGDAQCPRSTPFTAIRATKLDRMLARNAPD